MSSAAHILTQWLGIPLLKVMCALSLWRCFFQSPFWIHTALPRHAVISNMIQYLLCLLCMRTHHKRVRCLQSAYQSEYVVRIPHCSFLSSIVLSRHVLMESSVGSWLIGVDSADNGLLRVLVISMLVNIAPTTTTLPCASAPTGPC